MLTSSRFSKNDPYFALLRSRQLRSKEEWKWRSVHARTYHRTEPVTRPQEDGFERPAVRYLADGHFHMFVSTQRS
jgi:hypothetical protein